MGIRVVREPIRREELSVLAAGQFGTFVKAVVDVEQQIMAIGGELHADGEALLLKQGSHQEHLWGVNLYPAKAGDGWVAFDSMINVRPSQGNPSRHVEDTSVQRRIRAVVDRLVL